MKQETALVWLTARRVSQLWVPFKDSLSCFLSEFRPKHWLLLVYLKKLNYLCWSAHVVTAKCEQCSKFCLFPSFGQNVDFLCIGTLPKFAGTIQKHSTQPRGHQHQHSANETSVSRHGCEWAEPSIIYTCARVFFWNSVEWNNREIFLEDLSCFWLYIYWCWGNCKTQW